MKTDRQTRDKSDSETNFRLTPRHRKALQALMSQRVGETMEELAERAGVSRASIYRYLQAPEFKAEFDRRVSEQLNRHKPSVLGTLVKGATNPKHKQHAQLQSLYWRLTGDLQRESNVRVQGEIDLNHVPVLDVSSLSIDAQREMLKMIEQANNDGNGRNGQGVIDIDEAKPFRSISPLPLYKSLPSPRAETHEAASPPVSGGQSTEWSVQDRYGRGIDPEATDEEVEL